jgi:hypothetical protein
MTLKISTVDRLEQILSLMDRYMITSFKCEGLELERPPLAPQHPQTAVQPTGSVEDTLKEALGITSPEEYEFQLSNLDRTGE